MTIHHSFTYHCPACKNDVELEMEIESYSDYYLLDEGCPDCGAEIDEYKLNLAQKAVDCFAARADLLRDIAKDNYE